MNRLTIYPIASGSTGNSNLIQIGPYYVLIDIGLSPRRINESLKYNGLSLDDIDVLLITHTHSDHINGLSTFDKHYCCPVFASKTTKTNLDNYEINALTYNKKVEVLSNLFVTAFKTSHDCPGSCGYIIEYQDNKVGYATDLGIINDKILNYLKGSDAIIIESNHDLDMLKDGPYPIFLKNRIKSDKGHLSNDICAKTINELIKYGTKYFFLAHLSRENNRPEVALYATQKIIKDKKTKVYCLPIYGHDKYIVKYTL